MYKISDYLHLISEKIPNKNSELTYLSVYTGFAGFFGIRIRDQPYFFKMSENFRGKILE